MAAPFAQSVVCPILIGRAPNLQALDQLIEQVRGGRGETVLIAGEAGIGKSRLVAETKTRARAQPNTLILQGHCFEPDRALPYAPVLDLLRVHLAARPPHDIACDLGSTAPELVKLLPELATRLPDLAPSPPLEPEQEKRRLFEALTQFFMRLAAPDRVQHPERRGAESKDAPRLVIIEDLHWSDDTSLEFLLSFARRIASLPILLLLTYRDDEVHPSLSHFLAGLDRERLATELALTRLSRAEVDAMIQVIFDLGDPSTRNSWNRFMS